MKKFWLAAVIILLLPSLPLGGQEAKQTKGPLPKVVSALVPFYPLLAPEARIQGIVKLRVSTDGKTVSAIDAESGPPMLARAAKENVKTWEFEPHAPGTFEAVFHYKLLLPTECDSECNCDSLEKESLVLHLPSDVEVSAKIPVICDPVGPTVGANPTKVKRTAPGSLAQDKPAETSKSLPEIITASVPFYPEPARQTRIQGTVTLRVSTDGTLVSAVEAKSGHPILVEATTENVKSWEFKPHTPTIFETTFRYSLFVPRCDSECNCDRGEHGEKESVLLHLPAEVDLNAPTLLTCDPAVAIRQKKK